MVIPVRAPTGDERGQLILIGAIAIALILIGLVVVVNTAMFTEVVGTEGTVETAKEGGVAADELSRSVSTIVHERNLEEDGASDVDAAISSNDDVEHLEAQLQNRSLDGAGAYVDVEYLGHDQSGTRLTQSDPASLTNASGNGDWEPVPASSPGGVGGFVVVRDVAASTTGQTFEIDVEDDGGASTHTLGVEIDSASEVSIHHDGTEICDGVEATNDEVRIDVTGGAVYEDPSCTFELFAPGGADYAVAFSNGDAVEGTYDLVTSGTPNSADTDSAADQPSEHGAVWTYDLAYTYDIDEVTHRGEREVAVYA